MVEPLSLEELCCLIGRYPLIFRVKPEDVGSPDGSVSLQREFYNFVHSHRDVFEEAVQGAVDELRGTGAVLGDAMLDGVAHMIELYLGRPSTEDHLLMVVASVYTWKKPELERALGRMID